jgi:chemotaxis protein MotB
MRGKSPEKDRSERYLLTYADLMNLLLILFIVLFCTSKQDVVKAAQVMQAIKNGFLVTTNSSSSQTAAGRRVNVSSSASTDYSDFYNQLIALLKQRGILDKVDITADDNQVVISLKDDVLFAPGKADLGPDATSLLSIIGNLMTKILYGQLIIEGHTDSDPIHTSQFQDNRELSLIRAYNVSEIFEKSGLDPKKILPVGYGDNWPIAPNDNAVDKAKNRRVVITILRKSVTPPDQSVGADELIKTLQDAAVGQTESQASAVEASSGKAASKSSTASK